MDAALFRCPVQPGSQPHRTTAPHSPRRAFSTPTRPLRRLAQAIALLIPGCSLNWDGQLPPPGASQEAERGAGSSGDDAATPDAGPGLRLDHDALLWFAADRGLSESGAGKIKRWADQSGGQHDATSVTPEGGPRSSEHEGLPVVDFDGSVELKLPPLPALAELTFFSVAGVHESADEARCPSILHLANLDDSVYQDDYIDFRRQKQELLYQVVGERVKVEPEGKGSFPATTLHVLSVVHHSDQTVVMKIDGRTIGGRPTPLPKFTERSYNFIGHNHFHDDAGAPQCDGFQGQLAEMLLFAQTLSDEERDRIEQELADKWGVELW